MYYGHDAALELQLVMASLPVCLRLDTKDDRTGPPFIPPNPPVHTRAITTLHPLDFGQENRRPSTFSDSDVNTDATVLVLAFFMLREAFSDRMMNFDLSHSMTYRMINFDL
ncbi:hypothetical protein RRG08_025701 [Elysia crispata]|uniref:Uncharacterized protein n=1 Tax=Elysia crispata TaxID=231223 RepID=A0AAE1AX52_9GAST|nr:hypothetical protein RRG08_025701 [Elysia crispata]